jgi:hypothetical protein
VSDPCRAPLKRAKSPSFRSGAPLQGEEKVGAANNEDARGRQKSRTLRPHPAAASTPRAPLARTHTHTRSLKHKINQSISGENGVEKADLSQRLSRPALDF